MTAAAAPLVLTLGEPAGVGPEIIVKALTASALYIICRPVVIGNLATLQKAAAVLGLKANFRKITRLDKAGLQPLTIDVISGETLDQQVAMQGRHRRQGEQECPSRQPELTGRGRPGQLELPDEGVGRMDRTDAQVPAEPAPQVRLPALVGPGIVIELDATATATATAAIAAVTGADATEWNDRLTVTPARQPVLAIGHVLLEQAGRTGSQLQSHRRIGAGQIAIEARMPIDQCRIAEGPIDPPGQLRGGERGRLRHARQHPADHPPLPAGQKIEAQIGADPGHLGRGQRQVASDARTGHDDLDRLEHAGRPTLPELVQQVFGEALEMIRRKHAQHRPTHYQSRRPRLPPPLREQDNRGHETTG